MEHYFQHYIFWETTIAHDAQVSVKIVLHSVACAHGIRFSDQQVLPKLKTADSGWPQLFPVCSSRVWEWSYWAMSYELSLDKLPVPTCYCTPDCIHWLRMPEYTHTSPCGQGWWWNLAWTVLAPAALKMGRKGVGSWHLASFSIPIDLYVHTYVPRPFHPSIYHLQY